MSSELSFRDLEDGSELVFVLLRESPLHDEVEEEPESIEVS